MDLSGACDTGEHYLNATYVATSWILLFEMLFKQQLSTG